MVKIKEMEPFYDQKLMEKVGAVRSGMLQFPAFQAAGGRNVLQNVSCGTGEFS